ncbi:MAG TPA: recombinase family protein [Bacteroidia bacterium]|jgi:DNA invertase Pin-like site-specific DNA recombinase|nr:recombinase family protein [Bacteroidia bacterium]
MKHFYYSRVSTIGQNASRQTENFKVHGFVTSENIFVDKIQGDVPFFERPEAIKLFDVVTSFKDESVTLIIDSIDRLGRNLIDVLKTIDVFTQNKISIKSLKEGFETLMENGKENPMAKIVCSVMGSIAEMERNRIKERTSEGIAIAKANGVYKGRKVGSLQNRERLLQRHEIVVKKLKKGIAVRDIAQMTGKSTATIMKVKKVLESLN